MKSEKIGKKKLKKNSNIKMLGSFLKTSWYYFVALIIAAFVSTVSAMLLPKAIGYVVDYIIGNENLSNLSPIVLKIFDFLGGRDYLRENLLYVALAIVAIGLFRLITMFINRVLGSQGNNRLINTIRDELFKKVQRLPSSWHSKNNTGDIIQRCTSDAEMIKNFVGDSLINTVRMLIMIVLSVVFMFSENPKLAAISFCIVPVMFIYSFFFFKKIRAVWKDADEKEAALSTICQENLTGVRVVRAFGRERFERDKYEKGNKTFFDSLMYASVFNTMYWTCGDLIAGLLIIAIFGFGLKYVSIGAMTLGGFIAFLSYSDYLLWPARNLGRLASSFTKAAVAFKRINYIMFSESEQDDKLLLPADFHGDIEFKNVTFGYEQDKPVLKDVSFKIESGKVLGILGGTGSGKSTVCALLDKLYNVDEGQGEITIGGVNIRNIKTEDLRNNIGFVLQEPYLYSQTIKENIAITQPGISMEEIRHAATVAAVDDNIANFKDGYETTVGERGVTLSGGQKQRVAISRMLMQKAPIMIFDDSLSAVDSETDSKIRKALKREFKSSTVIIVAHRITTVMNADNIIVLDDGKIIEHGTPDELMGKDSVYKKIYDMQMSLPDDIKEEMLHEKN